MVRQSTVSAEQSYRNKCYQSQTNISGILRVITYLRCKRRGEANYEIEVKTAAAAAASAW